MTSKVGALVIRFNDSLVPLDAFCSVNLFLAYALVTRPVFINDGFITWNDGKFNVRIRNCHLIIHFVKKSVLTVNLLTIEALSIEALFAFE